jgi:hypothetical protein
MTQASARLGRAVVVLAFAGGALGLPSARSQERAAAVRLSAQEQSDLLTRLRENLWRDRQLEEQYTYLERRRDVRVSKMGKVSLGPVRTFEVYPSATPGRTYKRLVDVDGVSLAAGELARRDAEHRANMLWEKRRLDAETPAQRASRARRDLERRDRERRELEEAFAAFDIRPVGRERLEGHAEPFLRMSLSPRRDAPAHSDLVKYLKRFDGWAWVDPAAGQLVRLDLRAIGDVTVGWGLIGRVHAGSTASYERRLVDGEVWLPWRSRLTVTGRALLFRKFEFETETVWWDHKKYSVEATVIGPKGQ